MKRLVRIIGILFVAALVIGALLSPGVRLAFAQSPQPPTPEVEQALREALQAEISANQKSILGLMLYDVDINNIVYSEDGRTALLWLQQREPDTGEVIGTEPGLAIATNIGGEGIKAVDWSVKIQSTAGFLDLVNQLPPELLNEDLVERFTAQDVGIKAAQTYTGYKLPWSNALNIKITGSVGHFLDYGSCAEASCRYAYDFWNPDASNRMFPLLASKGGIVWAYKETCNNGDTNCTNYLVLRDESTNPVTYQLYYHMAKSSVPDSFVSKQTYVPQGAFIGNVDDTGYSTDHHLHFHVYTAPSNSSYSWGNSVRILFSDVPYNGGEPRTCSETTRYPSYGTECSVGPDGKKGTSDDNYLQSGNVGANPPSGSLSAPAEWSVITARTMDISGAASDNLGINKVQVMVNTDGTWRAIDTANYANGGFSKAVDLCTAGIADGPFGVAVRIFDVEGNWAGKLTGMRQVIKNYPCATGGVTPPAPACTPGAGQVGIYADANLAGTCQRLNAGTFNAAALGSLNNAISSIQVPSGTCASLFDRDNADPLGRVETFTAGDFNLSDNRIGTDRASTLIVEPCANAVDEPFLTFPGNLIDTDGNSRLQPNPAGPTSADSVVLSWTGGSGSQGFTSSLTRNGAAYASMAQAATNTWSVGTLPAGSYSWTVTAVGSGTTNSETLAFTVGAGSLPATNPATAPVNYTMEDTAPGWTGTGIWKLMSLDRPQRGATKAWVYTGTNTFGDSAYRAGDLTSPPITIPGNNYYLRFRFFSDVEGMPYDIQRLGLTHWDQRRVQISTDNGVTFTDLYLLSEDTQGIIWMDSPAISLAAYSGKTIRLRFHFDAVDNLDNGGLGWAVDDVRIDTSAPPACGDNNNSVSTAQAVSVNGAAIQGVICPGGDGDFYSFSGTAGAALRIDLDAKSLNANNPLDSVVTLLDANGRDVVAINDDEDPNNAEARYRDSLINLSLPRTGTYYVRVRAWDHPGSGGTAHTYNLTLSQSSSVRPNSVTMVQPHPQGLPVVPFIVEAGVQDNPAGGGIRQVDFFWHSTDWENSAWVKFGSDTTSTDGWFGIFDPAGKTISGSAFYILATNATGGSNGVLATNLAQDLTAPTSAMNKLATPVNSTAVVLSWTASDLQNDIDYFQFQYRFNGGAWTDWADKPDGSLRSAWFIGQPGTYDFRMRSVDNAGNQEAYPTAAETTVVISAACTGDADDAATDTSRTSARVHTLNSSVTHRLCQNDTDWVKFDLASGQEVMVMLATRGGATVNARLTNSNGTLNPTLASGRSNSIGAGVVFRWKAPSAGTYYLEVTSADARIWGTDVQYVLYIGDPHQLNLPLVGR